MSTTMKGPDANTVALWLVAGFGRHWKMQQVYEACGIPFPQTPEEAHALHERLPLLPDTMYFYKTPVRAFVSMNWPKLNQYLISHAGDAERLQSAVKELRAMRCNQARGVVLSDDDRNEARRNDLVIRKKAAGSAAAKTQRYSGSRSAWNVCKK